MIEQAIFTVLSTSATITALVGTRIYPLVLPEEPTLPALTYQIIASVNRPSLASAKGLVKIRMQFDCWGATYSDSVTLRKAVIDALAGLSQTVGDVTIQNVLPLNSTDYFDHEALQYQARVEFYLFH